MDALETIHTRRSIRKYAETPVSDEQVKALLDAAMSAPTAGGVQGWHFVVITDRALLDSIPDIQPYTLAIRQAPLAILVCGDTTSERYGNYWVQDCSAAMQNILLAARAMNLGSLWCGIHPIPEREAHFSERFKLPAHVRPLGLAIIGHTEQPFERKERYDETKVHHNTW